MDEKGGNESRNDERNIGAAGSNAGAGGKNGSSGDKAAYLLMHKYLDDLLAGKVPALPADLGDSALPAQNRAGGGAPNAAAGAAATAGTTADAGGTTATGAEGAAAAGAIATTGAAPAPAAGGTVATAATQAAGAVAPAGGAPGASSGPGSSSGEESEAGRVLEKLGYVVGQLAEMRHFLQALCQGDLDAQVPGRRNYIAAPLKELHTQLASLTWSMEQLAKGNVVSRLYYRGTLFESFNSLIQKIAVLANDESASQKSAVDPKAAQWEWSVNSWRYHQILSALNNLRIMVFEVAKDGKVVYANRPAREYLGDVTHLFDADGGFGQREIRVLEQYLAQVSNDGASFPLFKELYDEASESWYKITSDKIQLSDFSVNFLHMVDNISEWKQNESHLKKTATTDPLTGIYNRGFGLQTLEEALFAAKSGVPSCAAFIDLDNLKVINDLYGHNGGDLALRTIADVLASSVRDNKDSVCRFGGDEFIIVFKNCTKPFAEKAVSRMSDKLDELNQSDYADFNISFSYGIVEIDAKSDRTLQQVIERMDQEMYKRKFSKKQAAAASNGGGAKSVVKNADAAAAAAAAAAGARD
ncbi:MAG: GGDEF domain-containing protein [Clostridiales bacterium]|nr:GGDEF domain-containing protein [Clostridiales bacterium]